MYNIRMDRTVTVSQARSTLPEIVQRVTDGEEVTITRHGQAVAVVVRPDALRARRADAALEGAAVLHELLVTARDRPLDTAPPLGEARAEAMIEEVRNSRSRG
jgi:prevent-host-death family protein